MLDVKHVCASGLAMPEEDKFVHLLHKIALNKLYKESCD